MKYNLLIITVLLLVSCSGNNRHCSCASQGSGHGCESDSMTAAPCPGAHEICKSKSGSQDAGNHKSCKAESCAQKVCKPQYKLKSVLEVSGRQGIAIDSNYYYVSDSKALYKYSKDGTLVSQNLQPFPDPEAANHFGDIDCFEGEIYCGLERFEYGRGQNIAIAVYDAGTLEWKRNLPWEPASGQVEVSGLAVDRDRRQVWMSDWVDSRFVYCYDLDSGKYLTKMQCQPVPYWCQGIFVHEGKLLFSADDGDAQYGLPDNIYSVDLKEVPISGLKDGTVYSVEDGVVVSKPGKVPSGMMQGRVSLYREMNDFRRAGEIEGLAIDPVNQDLVVLNNRGTLILLGMSQGPLTDEGYTKEIHELYIYQRIK